MFDRRASFNRLALLAAVGLTACAAAPEPGRSFALAEIQVSAAVSAYQCPPEADPPGIHTTTVCAIHYGTGSCRRLPPDNELPRARCRWREQRGTGPWRVREGVFFENLRDDWRIDYGLPQPRAGGPE